MNPKKAKGKRSERKSVAFLEEQGFRCTRSGGSLGVWDVIGINAERVILVQVKSNRWPGTKERIEMNRFKAPPFCEKHIHVWRDGAGEPEREILL